MRRFQITLGRNTSVCLFVALGGFGLCSCSSSTVDPGNPAGGGATTQAGTSGSTQSQAGSTSGGSGAPTGGTGSGTSGTSTGGTAGGTGGASAGGVEAGGAGTGGSATGGGAGSGGTVDPGSLEKFSFFVTSMAAMRKLAKSDDGFGGDFRYGTADGLTGADKICSEIAESAMPGASSKQWHAFLSTVKGPVNAKDRIGPGPWYDRTGRLVAMNQTDLLQDRPNGADAAIKQDLPNETGTPNHRPNPNAPEDDNHHTLTGSKPDGTLYGQTATCMDWTTTSKDNVTTGRPRIGFSWSVQGRTNWISGQDEGGCGAGVTGVGTENGGSDPKNPIVGSGGGYGGIYCFAMVP
jgi:hypothetical protein